MSGPDLALIRDTPAESGMERPLFGTRSVRMLCVAAASLLAACGSGAVGQDPPAVGAREVEVVLGNGGGEGNVDGRGDAARFGFPSQVRALDADTMLVIDGASSRLRRVARDGTVTTFWSGPNKGNGVAGVARLPDGSVLVPSLFEQVVYRVQPDGSARVLAGREGEVERPVDGVGTQARFKWPWGGFNGQDGRAYVLDEDGRSIRSIDADGRVATVSMPALSTLPVQRFVDLAPAADGGWWAIDDHSRHVFRLDAEGRVTLAIPGVVRSADGTSTERFIEPTAIAVLGELVVIADPRGRAVRRIHGDGSVTTLYAAPCPEFDPCGPNGRAGEPPLRSPRGVAILDPRTIAVADSLNATIYLLDLEGRARRIAGLPAEVRAGPAFEPQPGGCIDLFQTARGEVLCRDVELAGWWHVAEGEAPRAAVALERVQAALDEAIAAVPDRLPYERDELRDLMLGATAPDLPADFSWAFVPAFGAGVAYGVSEHQHVVLRIDPAGGNAPRLLAGRENDPGARDGAAASARFRAPRGIAVGADGTVYVADTDNHAIRRIAPDGSVSTWAGRLGVSGATDGAGEAARFVAPTRLIVGPEGALYVADEGIGAVRRIDADRRVTTYGSARVGSCICGGGCAPAVGPIAVDPRGRVWTVGDVANVQNTVVSLLGTDGTVQRVLGTPGRVGPATNGSADTLPTVFSIAFDARGDLLLATRDSLLRVRAATLEKRLASLTAARAAQPPPAMCPRDAGA